MTKDAPIPLWLLSRARIGVWNSGTCLGHWAAAHVRGATSDQAYVRARCALCARAVPLLSLHQAEPGRSPGENPDGEPGPVRAGPEPGTRMPGRRHCFFNAHFNHQSPSARQQPEAPWRCRNTCVVHAGLVSLGVVPGVRTMVQLRWLTSDRIWRFWCLQSRTKARRTSLREKGGGGGGGGTREHARNMKEHV